MRIIAGKYKRRNLKSLPGNDVTRPTGDRIKEGLFNILEQDLTGKRFLDLFSGSGSVGIEALSRGADYVIFVEKNKEATKVLQENLDALEVPKDTYRVLCMDVERLLQTNPQVEPFDVIFADPPYHLTAWYEKSLSQIFGKDWLAEKGTCILEMDVKRSLKEKFGEKHNLFDERHYGKTRLEFWEK